MEGPKVIPIEFTHAGRYYSGYFSRVGGAGSTMYDLTIDGYHAGQLWYISPGPGLNSPRHPPSEGHWRFGSNSHPEFSELTDEFEFVIISATQ